MESEREWQGERPTSNDHPTMAVVGPDDARRALVDLAPVGLSYSDETGNLVYVNDRWRHLARCDDRYPIPLARVIELIDPGDHVAVLEAMTTATLQRTEATTLLRLADPDDDRQLSLTVRHIPEGVHESVRFMSILSDVTELTRALDEVRRSEQRFRTVTSTLPVAVFRTGPGGEVTWANEWMKEISGYDLDEFLGRSSFDLIHPEDRARAWEAAVAAAADGAPFESEHRFLRKDGTERWVLVRTTPIRDTSGRIVEHVGTLEDVTGYHMRTRELAHAAAHDPLTQVPNRASLLTLLEAECASSRGRQEVGVIFIDLDDFKAVNDEHGHQAGDAVLVEVARRLTSATREHDLVGRFAGDEFMVVCPGTDDLRAVQAVAERARRLVEDEPVRHGEDDLAVRVSIGCAIGPGASSVPELIQLADQAMYADKRHRRG